jgi:hypothetical protein
MPICASSHTRAWCIPSRTSRRDPTHRRGPRTTPTPMRPPGRSSRNYSAKSRPHLNFHRSVRRLAQRLEHLVYTEGVVGSNPSPPTIPTRRGELGLNERAILGRNPAPLPPASQTVPGTRPPAAGRCRLQVRYWYFPRSASGMSMNSMRGSEGPCAAKTAFARSSQVRALPVPTLKMPDARLVVAQPQAHGHRVLHIDEVAHLLAVLVVRLVGLEQLHHAGLADLPKRLVHHRAHVALVVLARAVDVEEFQAHDCVRITPWRSAHRSNMCLE